MLVLAQLVITSYSIHYTKLYDLVDELAKCFRKSNKNASEIEIRKDIEKILRTPENKINNHNKINSEKELLLMLSPTPKIISCIKKDGRNPYLVGFKLLNNVTEEELLNAANKQADSNGCDLVLANDLKFINEGTHIGLLIKNGEIISKLLGKEAIAIGIVEEMFKSLKEKNNYCTF